MYDETLDGKLIICEAYLQGGRDETPDGQPTTYRVGGTRPLMASLLLTGGRDETPDGQPTTYGEGGTRPLMASLLLTGWAGRDP